MIDVFILPHDIYRHIALFCSTFSVELISLCLQTPQILALVVHSQLDDTEDYS